MNDDDLATLITALMAAGFMSLLWIIVEIF